MTHPSCGRWHDHHENSKTQKDSKHKNLFDLGQTAGSKTSDACVGITDDVVSRIRFCAENTVIMNDWEKKFVSDITGIYLHAGTLSKKQLAKLDAIVTKILILSPERPDVSSPLNMGTQP
jgi:hypothetical protein